MNPAGSRFCRNCGTPLLLPPRAQTPPRRRTLPGLLALLALTLAAGAVVLFTLFPDTARQLPFVPPAPPPPNPYRDFRVTIQPGGEENLFHQGTSHFGLISFRLRVAMRRNAKALRVRVFAVCFNEYGESLDPVPELHLGDLNPGDERTGWLVPPIPREAVRAELRTRCQWIPTIGPYF